MPSTSPELYDAEAMFLHWFNSGDRRTLTATAAYFDCAYNTARRYASEHDWDGRADEIDAEARKLSAKRMGRLVMKQREVHVDLLRSIETRFLRRLMDKLPDGSPNPDALPLSSVGVREVIDTIKALELLMGGATERIVTEESDRYDLAAIEAEIATLDEQAMARGETIDA